MVEAGGGTEMGGGGGDSPENGAPAGKRSAEEELWIGGDSLQQVQRRADGEVGGGEARGERERMGEGPADVVVQENQRCGGERNSEEENFHAQEDEPVDTGAGGRVGRGNLGGQQVRRHRPEEKNNGDGEIPRPPAATVESKRTGHHTGGEENQEQV